MLKIDLDALGELIRSAVSSGVREGFRLGLEEIDWPVQEANQVSSRPLMTLDEVSKFVCRSRSSIYRDVERGVFPAPVKTGSKANAWFRSEVRDWLSGLPRRKNFG